MAWFHIVLPAFTATLLMILDARRPRGVYWAFSQLLPGVAQLPPYADSSVYFEMFEDRSLFRMEFVRRFAWGLFPGGYLALVVDGSSAIDAAAAGLLTAGFVLWPVFFHGLPLVNSRRWLLLLYAGVAAMLVGVSVLGFAIAQAFRGALVEQAASWLFSAVAILVAAVVMRLVWSYLRPLTPWLEAPAMPDDDSAAP